MAGWLDDQLGIGGMQQAQDPFAELLKPKEQQRFDVGAALGVPPTAMQAPPVAANLPPPPDAASFLSQPMPDEAPALAPKPQKPPKLTPEQQIAATYEKEQLANRQLAATEAAKNAYVSEQGLLAETKRANEERVLEEERSKVFADVDRRQQQITAEVQAQGQKKIDPKAGLKGGGVMAAAAMGFLEGFLGKPHQVVAIMDKVIERNVATQMQNLEREDRALGQKQALLDRDATRAGQRLDMQLQATLRGYDTAQRIIQTEAAKRFGSDVAAKRVGVLNTQIEQKKAAAVQDYRDKRTQLGLQAAANALTKRQQDLSWAARQQDVMLDITKGAQAADAAGRAAQAFAAGGGPAPPPGMKPEEARKLQVFGVQTVVDPKTGKQTRKQVLLGYAADTTSREETTKGLEMYEKFRGDLTHYRELIDKNGGEFAGVFGIGKTEARQQMEATHSRLLVAAKELAKLGVISGPDLDLMLKQVPEPVGPLRGKGSMLPRLDDVIQRADANVDTFLQLRIQGAQPYSSFGLAEQYGASPGDVATEAVERERKRRADEAERERQRVMSSPYAASTPGALGRAGR